MHSQLHPGTPRGFWQASRQASGNPDAGRILFSRVGLRDLNLEKFFLRMRFVFQLFACHEGVVAEKTPLGSRRELLGGTHRIESIEELTGTRTGCPSTKSLAMEPQVWVLSP